jgi:hypothetical protein
MLHRLRRQGEIENGYNPMTIGNPALARLNQLSSFSMYPENLSAITGMPQRKESAISTRTIIRGLTAAGLTICISLSALAEEVGLNSTPTPAAGLDRLNGIPAGELADRHHEMRDKWQKMSPDERAERRKAMREHWEKMPPDERSEMRKKMKEHWMKMPPEEREARRKEMREHWEKMSPEERDQFKRDMGKH